jgi:hypothetical protein
MTPLFSETPWRCDDSDMVMMMSVYVRPGTRYIQAFLM